MCWQPVNFLICMSLKVCVLENSLWNFRVCDFVKTDRTIMKIELKVFIVIVRQVYNGTVSEGWDVREKQLDTDLSRRSITALTSYYADGPVPLEQIKFGLI